MGNTNEMEAARKRYAKMIRDASQSVPDDDLEPVAVWTMLERIATAIEGDGQRDDTDAVYPMAFVDDGDKLSSIEGMLKRLTTQARESLDEILSTLGRIDGAKRQGTYRQAFEDGVATAALRIASRLCKEGENAKYAKLVARATEDGSAEQYADVVIERAAAWANSIESGEWLQDDEECIETVRADEVRVGQVVEVDAGDYKKVMARELTGTHVVWYWDANDESKWTALAHATPVRVIENDAA